MDGWTIDDAKRAQYTALFQQLCAEAGGVTMLGKANAGLSRSGLPVDVLMSIVSWMYHYPEAGYLASAVKLIKLQTGRVIITPKKMEQAKRDFIKVGFTACSQSGFYLVCCVECTSPLRGA